MPVQRPTVVLIGMRGVGKTSIARPLAERLGVEWRDTDQEIEARSGLSVREIFETRGEASFRAAETTVLGELLDAKPKVLSVGGGAVVRAENRKLLRNRAHCIWLTAPLEELVRRLERDERSASLRPALTALSPLEELRELLALRTPLYRELAADEFDTGGRTIAEIVELIHARLTMP